MAPKYGSQGSWSAWPDQNPGTRAKQLIVLTSARDSRVDRPGFTLPNHGPVSSWKCLLPLFWNHFVIWREIGVSIVLAHIRRFLFRSWISALSPDSSPYTRSFQLILKPISIHSPANQVNFHPFWSSLPALPINFFHSRFVSGNHFVDLFCRLKCCAWTIWKIQYFTRNPRRDIARFLRTSLLPDIIIVFDARWDRGTDVRLLVWVENLNIWSIHARAFFRWFHISAVLAVVLN
jgi:hypothetical protein